jgi:hypothetical protein
MQNVFQVFVVAGVFLATGTATGIAVAPLWRAPQGCQAATPGPVSEPREHGSAPDPDATQTARLGVVVAALRQLPRLRAEPETAGSEHGPQLLERRDLPPPVEAVLRQVTLGRDPRRLRLEHRQRQGQPVFEVNLELDGVVQEYTIDPQGKVLEAEADMGVSELPTAVTTGIQAALPGAVLLAAEREQEDGAPPHYEIEIRADGRRHELNVSEDGTITRQKTR